MNSLLEASDLWMVYKLGEVEVEALRGVSLTVRSGDFTAIMGPSGSGKSTLLHLLGLLERPTRGKVAFAGQDVSKLGDRALTRIRARSIGFVFQTFNLIPTLTVRENVSIQLRLAGVARRDLGKRAEEALAQVGLADRLRHRPAQLSGGERQRVAIARAIAKRPQVVLADEPTGNLDSQRGAEILDNLRELNRDGQTVLIITHDAELAGMADRVIGLHDGQIVPNGV